MVLTSSPKGGEVADDRAHDDNSGDHELPMVFPGHRANAERYQNPDLKTRGGKPFLVTLTFPRAAPVTTGHDSKEAADEFAEDAIRRADRGMKDDEKSLWD